MNIKQLLDHCESNPSDKLPQLLQQVTISKNEQYAHKVITILQKQNHTNVCVINIQNNQIAIIDFVQFARTEFDETISIKLMSTLLHLIDQTWMNNCIRLLNLLLQFTQSDNSIIQQSAIQGILSVIANIPEQQLFELLELFFLIQQDKTQTQINTGYNLILCNPCIYLGKDIFIMLLQRGKQFNKQDFYTNKLYKYLSQVNISIGNPVLQRINHIRLLFAYIHLMGDKFELLPSLITLYGKCNAYDISKIAFHDGILLLYSDKQIFEKLVSNPVNGFNSYHEYIIKMIYSLTLESITEYISVIWKQSNQLVNLSAQYLEFNPQSATKQFIFQITQLIHYSTDHLIRNDCQVNKQLTWRPILKLFRHFLVISNLSQYEQQVNTLIKWINSQQPDILIRFLASISSPANIDQSEKWIISYKLLINVITNHMDQFSSKTWNSILQTMQRVELLSMFPEETNGFFINSNDYLEETIYRVIDGLTQLALQISEKMQTSENNKDYDSSYKLFAVDKLVLIVQSNVMRINSIWSRVEALLMCLCCSKMHEIRQSALNSLKSILFICVDAQCLSLNLLNPISELINSRFDDVVEYIMNLLYILIKDHQIQKALQSDLIKIIETLLNEKEEFIHLILCLNCLNELVFNQLDSLNDQCLMRLSSILVYTTKYLSKQYHNDIKNKIISMIWQLQLKQMQHKLVNPGLWNTSLRLLKETLDQLDELKFAALHMASSFCLCANEDQFNEAFEVFEELITQSVHHYLKLEFQQICLINNTPRFHSNLIETPKFQVSSIKFDKQTIIEQYKQSLEAFKLCLQLWVDIIIAKDRFEKFYYYIQLFNQPQLVYAKHELVAALAKILQHTKSEIELSLDVVSSLLDNEQMDTSYFLENQTFHYVCQILKHGFSRNHEKSFIVTQKLMNLVCVDSLLSENTILKYFMQHCLAELDLDEGKIIKWATFFIDQFGSVGVQLRYHKLLEMICLSFEMIIKININETLVEYIVKFIKQLLIQLNKCQRFTNDNSERLQLIFISKLKSLLALILQYISEDTLTSIVEPIMIQSRRNNDWVQYFLSLPFNERQENIMVEILTAFYINQIITRENISQQTTVINIISLLQQESSFANKIFKTIKQTLFETIYLNLASYVDEPEKNNEKEYNLCLMLDFLLKEQIPFHPCFLKLIMCQELQIRLKVIEILKKFN